jgi:hypothetical protein
VGGIGCGPPHALVPADRYSSFPVLQFGWRVVSKYFSSCISVDVLLVNTSALVQFGVSLGNKSALADRLVCC